MSQQQWYEWLNDPDCAGAEYGACHPDEPIHGHKHDGCWMHDHYDGGYHGDYPSDVNSDDSDFLEQDGLYNYYAEDGLVGCSPCAECRLGRKMLRHVGI